MIALIDLGMNNTTSIKKAFDRVGCEVKVTQKSSELDNADAIILPTAVNEKFYDDINLMSPFGAGNKEPFFIIRLKTLSIIINHSKL